MNFIDEAKETDFSFFSFFTWTTKVSAGPNRVGSLGKYPLEKWTQTKTGAKFFLNPIGCSSMKNFSPHYATTQPLNWENSKSQSRQLAERKKQVGKKAVLLLLLRINLKMQITTAKVLFK